MVDRSAWENVRGLIPHYLVLVLLILLGLRIAERLLGPLGFWGSLALATAIAVAYPLALRAAGRAPAGWQ